MEFAYAGGGLGKGGKVTLYTDGKKVGEEDVAMTLAMVFSADDGCDVGGARSRGLRPAGRCLQRPRGGACSSRSPTPPSILDHLVSPEEAIRIALARQ